MTQETVDVTVQETLDKERQRVIDRVLDAAKWHGWCSEVATALGYVYGDPEVHNGEPDGRAYNEGLKFYHSQTGLNAQGFDRDGWNEDGYDVNGYNREGYDRYGYNRDGYDHDGFTRGRNWCEECRSFHQW